MLGKYFITLEMWILRYWGSQALDTFQCVYAAGTFADWQGRGSSPLGLQSPGLHGAACMSQGLFDGFLFIPGSAWESLLQVCLYF